MAVCKKCGMQIQWKQENGKWIPYSDGEKHWEMCRKPITESTLMTYSSGWNVGRSYIEVKCDCGIPPWEVCKHSTLP